MYLTAKGEHMYYIIDRIEGDIAVCEADDMSHVDIPLSLLPENVKEGSILKIGTDNEYIIDEEAEKERKQRILKKQKRLFS